MTEDASPVPLGLPAVCLISAALLGYEIALLRILLYASWHHFAFLVISIAMLGFGASGTGLSLLEPGLRRRAGAAARWLLLSAALAMPLSFALFQRLDLQARFLPALFVQQLSAWILGWMLLGLPFLLGGAAIGLALMGAGPRLAAVYAVNLAGSALGSGLALVLMLFLPPAWLPAALGALALAGLTGRRASGPPPWLSLALASMTALILILAPPRIPWDPYKYRSHVQNLLEEGRAMAVGRVQGPRGIVEAFQGEAFHELAFLAPGAHPPRLTALLRDGHWAGSLLEARSEGEAAAVDQTLMSLAYDFVPDSPRVLLLGETGGANLWLALRRNAVGVTLAQPSGEMIELVQGPLADQGGAVFAHPRLDLIQAEPRHWVERDRTHYDLVQMALMESWSLESGGLGGLGQSPLLTVEGLGACLDRLGAAGVLSCCRALQLPPREQAKLLATIIAALRQRGVDAPERHLVLVRDFLAACLLVKASPWTEAEIELVRARCRERELTPVFWPGLRDGELNRPDAMPGPPGAKADWLHHVAVSLLGDEAERFIAAYPFDIRPATDERPFFANFARLSTLPRQRQAYGPLWLTRGELALPFVLAAALVVTALGALLTLLPLLLRRPCRRARGKTTVALVFGALGLAYLSLEMVLLSRLTLLFGDPVLAGAATLAGFLVFSGWGSAMTRRPISRSMLATIFAALIGVGCLELLGLKSLALWGGALPTPLRLLLALVAVAPLGFLMGFPFPIALARLSRREAVLVPWAWGVNGFASVLAPPLATAMGMLWGFSSAGGLALGAYLLAGVLIWRDGK